MKSPLRLSADNCDRYARTWHGYIGKRRVIVVDGRVTSHGNQDWHEFLQACTRRHKRRTRFQSQLCQAYIRHLDDRIRSQRPALEVER